MTTSVLVGLGVTRRPPSFFSRLHANFLVLVTLLVSMLAACGGSGNDPEPSDNPVSAQSEMLEVSLLAADNTQRTKTANNPSLLDLTGPWHTWSGLNSQVSYDSASNTLRIPAPSEDMAIGVQRYDQSLIAGHQYTLNVRASNPEAAAIIFLFDGVGKIVRIDQSNNKAQARHGSPLTFTAPVNVAGFYLQVQNQWRADSATALTAQLTENAGESVAHPVESNHENMGNNLIAIRGDWPDWSGAFTGVTLTTSATQLVVPAPSGDADNVIGVRRFSLPLQVGVEYEWSLIASEGAQSSPSALLFLMNRDHEPVHFIHPVTNARSTWLTATPNEPKRFRVPADIIGYSIQVQSGYRATERALLTPMLRRVPDSTSPQSPESEALIVKLTSLIQAASPGGINDFAMPLSKDLSRIPQPTTNPLTPEKIALGALLFHETALASAGNNPALAGTWSCASCHHVHAGFKAGVPQGIGEGGVGFGAVGEGRRLEAGFDALAPDGHPLKPDVQPVASPTALNTAYQSVMLWNGQFGNDPTDSVNADVDPKRLLTQGTPKSENARALPGLEIQAVAGLSVHRMKVHGETIVQTNPEYRRLFDAAYPLGSTDVLEDGAKAIAAYERTLLSNEAPFQRWLRGEANTMGERELRGAVLFFGDAGCVACHRGPALSSEPGADADALFFAVGFADLDLTDPRVHGGVSNADSRGRGGFTGQSKDDYHFKIPQLYNLADADVLGHGASFGSIRQVIDYKNAGEPQNIASRANLDSRFRPLGLTSSQVDDLTAFLTTALRDTGLKRYVPESLPSGMCFPVADTLAGTELGC